MEFLAHYGMFLLKCLTLLITLLLAVAGIFALGKKPRPKLQITSLNEQYRHTQDLMNEGTKKDRLKKISKKEKNLEKERPSLFVIDFHGDIRASQVEQLRESVTAILSIAQENDQIMLQLDSPGGAVNSYGLAASQLQRIRDKKIHLTVCIDKMAASGGYLMACLANEILAAPFAIIGSIGVVAQLPNLHRWLKKHDIDVELITAGEYKRTLTMLGENTDKGRKKFQEDLEKIHLAFRDFVLTNRQNLDIEKVSTGEHWLAVEARELRLIDGLKTSDEFIIEKMPNFNVFKITIPHKQSLAQKLLKPAAQFLSPWAWQK